MTFNGLLSQFLASSSPSSSWVSSPRPSPSWGGAPAIARGHRSGSYGSTVFAGLLAFLVASSYPWLLGGTQSIDGLENTGARAGGYFRDRHATGVRRHQAPRPGLLPRLWGSRSCGEPPCTPALRGTAHHRHARGGEGHHPSAPALHLGCS
ncbi:hypothetical protein QJS66_06130 [Kocuria rhizophila]|nr:hypothetical protein QJS66_06130 [Kocuria rhizophila]